MDWSIIKTVVVGILAVIGGLTVILSFLKLLLEISPKIGELKASTAGTLAKKYRHKKLIKAAIKNDIENTVNRIVSDLQNELPSGWIKKANIAWVTKMSEHQIVEGKMILRMRPLESQEDNLMVGVYSFFGTVLFPETRSIIPKNTVTAVALELSRRAIERKNPELRRKFENDYIETEIQRDNSVSPYFEAFEEMDGRGFLCSAFLREVNEVAIRSRFKAMRLKIKGEIDAIIDHMRAFLNGIRGGHGITESLWSRIGPVTSYAFLLVARPEASGSKPYVARAKEKLNQNIERLYIMARKEQKQFAEFIFSEIAKIEGYKFVEVFDLPRDYRGELGGIGALFITKKFENSLREEISEPAIEPKKDENVASRSPKRI